MDSITKKISQTLNGWLWMWAAPEKPKAIGVLDLLGDIVDTDRNEMNAERSAAHTRTRHTATGIDALSDDLLGY